MTPASAFLVRPGVAYHEPRRRQRGQHQKANAAAEVAAVDGDAESARAAAP